MLLLFLYLLSFQDTKPVVELGWVSLESGNKASMRGLDVVNGQVAWFGGSGGVWGRTTNGGKSWETGKVAGGKLDFRDIHAIDAQTAIFMSAGAGKQSRIFRTEDGGQTWRLTFTNRWEKGFFNTIAFWDAQNGILLSDPIDDRPFLLVTANGGKSWRRLPADTFPPLMEGEYGFAASGSCIALAGKTHIWLATGGTRARVFHSADRGKTWAVSPAPLKSGNGSSGIFSIAFRNEHHGVVVGGNYQNEGETGQTVAFTADGGKTWTLSKNHAEVAYRSCVAPVAGKAGHWVAVGPAGSSFSEDDGKTWSNFAGGYHVLSFGPSPDSGFAAGRDGALGKLEF